VNHSRLAAFVEKLGLIDAPELDEPGSDGESTSTAQLHCDTTTRRVLREGDEAPPPQQKDAKALASMHTHTLSPNIYRVQRDDGTVLGPMAFPRLVEMFATGEVGPSVSIARESGRFKPASEYVELSRFMTSPALQWESEFPFDARESGPLDRAMLPTRLFQLAVRRETGALVLKDGTRKRRIFFVEGSPECVTSTDKKELLGEFLIERGQVLRMEVEMALAMLPRFGGRLGDALVGIHVLRPIELFRAIHDQTQERLVETFRWMGGEVAFARGVRSQEETFPLGVDTYELLVRGVRHGYDQEELERLLAPVSDQVLERVAVPPVRAEMFRLHEREAAVIEAVDGKTTLAKLAKRLTRAGTADPDEILRAAFLGLACELLHAPSWVVPPSFVKSK
jgi:serine/threonine-protein kinase